jgi:hypothetical protein
MGYSVNRLPALLWPDAGSPIWQAAAWRSLPVGIKTGLVVLQTASAKGQRV